MRKFLISSCETNPLTIYLATTYYKFYPHKPTSDHPCSMVVCVGNPFLDILCRRSLGRADARNLLAMSNDNFTHEDISGSTRDNLYGSQLASQWSSPTSMTKNITESWSDASDILKRGLKQPLESLVMASNQRYWHG